MCQRADAVHLRRKDLLLRPDKHEVTFAFDSYSLTMSSDINLAEALFTLA